MAFKVFISHSTADMGLVEQLRYWLEANGIEAYVAEIYPSPGIPLSQKVTVAITQSDCFLALLTRDGARSQWVNQEIGIAKNAERLIVPLVEIDVDPPGMIKEVNFVPFDPAKPVDAINWAVKFLYSQKVAKETQETQQRTIAVLVALFGLLAVAAAGSRKQEAPYS